MISENRKWSNGIRYMAIIGLILVIILTFALASKTVGLILTAALVAYILSPIVRFLNHRLKIKRGFAVLIAYLLLIYLIANIFMLIVPLITDKIQVFTMLDWPMILEETNLWFDNLIESLTKQPIMIAGTPVDLATPLINMRNNLNAFDAKSIKVADFLPKISQTIGSIVNFSSDIVGSIFSFLIMALTTTMASIHFCNDARKGKSWLVSLFDEQLQPEFECLLNRLGGVWNNYFVGQIKLMLIIGVATFTLTSALGLKWALVLGIFAGFCEIIPNIGPIISCVPAVISAAMFGSSWIPLNNWAIVLIVLVVYVLIQQFENILIVPRVMGDALELHPVIIILGIMVLSSTLGIFGALLAAPLLGILKEVFYFVLAKIKRQDPYPEIYAEAITPIEPESITS